MQNIENTCCQLDSTASSAQSLQQCTGQHSVHSTHHTLANAGSRAGGPVKGTAQVCASSALQAGPTQIEAFHRLATHGAPAWWLNLGADWSFTAGLKRQCAAYPVCSKIPDDGVVCIVHKHNKHWQVLRVNRARSVTVLLWQSSCMPVAALIRSMHLRAMMLCMSRAHGSRVDAPDFHQCPGAWSRA